MHHRASFVASCGPGRRDARNCNDEWYQESQRLFHPTTESVVRRCPPFDGSGNFEPERLRDEIGRWTSADGSKIRALREGRLIFSFVGDEYFPKNDPEALPEFSDLGDAIRHRLIRMNAYLAALYWTIVEEHRVGLHKMVVTHDDLMTCDFEDAIQWGGGR